MSGKLDLPTASDFPSALQQVIPADVRNFSNPIKSYDTMTYSIIDRNDAIDAGPLADAINSAINFSDKPIIEKENQDEIELKEKLPDIKNKLFLKSNDLIKQFQNFFSQNQPVIGKIYSGPIDGIVNNELISAAKKTENQINQTLNNNGASGMLWNNNSKIFNTSTVDLLNALILISEHKTVKSGYFHDLRQKSLQNILNNLQK